MSMTVLMEWDGNKNREANPDENGEYAGSRQDTKISEVTLNCNVLDGASTLLLEEFALDEVISLGDEKTKDDASCNEDQNDRVVDSVDASSVNHMLNRTKQLGLNSLPIIGREKELAWIEQAFHRLVNGTVKRQLVIISGKSGTGKTFLAQKFRKLIQTHIQMPRSNDGDLGAAANGLFVRGKYDPNSRPSECNDPYLGISRALKQICGALQQLSLEDKASFGKVVEELHHENFSTQLALLIQIIPELKEIVTEGQAPPNPDQLERYQITATPSNSDDPDSSCSSPDSKINSNSKHQLHFAVCGFVRIIAKAFSHLVMVLDDLHQAEHSSLELLNALISDQNTEKLLLVGIYRSNELDRAHLLPSIVEKLEKDHQEETDFELTRIHIEDLKIDHVQEIVNALVLGDDGQQYIHGANEKTFGLAKVCFEKTLGNTFFLRQFLGMLCSKRLLQFDFERECWVWNEDEIRRDTAATENVVDLLKDKMKALSDEHGLQQILQLAACFGSTFQLRLTKLVWNKLKQNTPNSEFYPEQQNDFELLEALAILECNNLIVRNSTRSLEEESYSWSHDKIQEAAMLLTPVVERVTFGREVGQILIRYIKEDDSAFFVGVKLLNNYSEVTQDMSNCLELAKLNYEASQKSMLMSAFDRAAEYAGKGIKLLPENSWTEQKELSLKLFSIGAKAECFLGNVETMDFYCNAVMQRNELSMEVKFVALNAYIDSLRNRGRVHEAVMTLLNVLRYFKCRFPSKRKVSVIPRFIYQVVKVKLNKKSRDLSSLREMTNPTRIELMKLLAKLATSLYMLHDERLALAVFRSLDWTLKYGYCEFSPGAFASVGIVLTGVMRDLQGGSKYGELALSLLEKTDGRETAAQTMFYVNALVFPWTKPAKELLAPLLKAHKLGLAYGDTESAIWSIYNYVVMKYFVGKSLVEMENNLRLYYKMIREMKGEHAFYFSSVSRIVRQTYLNLMGRNNIEDPTILIGDANDEVSLDHCLSHPFLKPGVQAYQGMIMTYFGQHVRQADWAIKLGIDEFSKTNVSNPEQMWESFLKGLSCFAAARETGQVKYLKIGNIFRSRVKGWVAMGNPNVVQYEPFLDAEVLAVKGKSNAAIRQYENSIALAEALGCHHDAALACERLCEYYLHLGHNTEKARAQFEKAHRHWTSWGAAAKTAHLYKKFSFLRPAMPSEVHVALSEDSPEL